MLIEKCARINLTQLIKEGKITKKDIFDNDYITINIPIWCPFFKRYDYETVNLYFSARTVFNRVRFYLQCPSCHRAVNDYYRPPIGGKFLCRHCHDLAYSCQNRHRNFHWETIDKWEHKLEKVRNKLGNKWLRTPTKQGLLDQYSRLEKVINSVRYYIDKH